MANSRSTTLELLAGTDERIKRFRVENLLVDERDLVAQLTCATVC
jgi:hypothetical protein